MDQMRLSGRDEGINVVVSSLCAACDDPEKVIQSIKNIFPEFETSSYENQTFPSAQKYLITEENQSMSNFIQIVSDQRILDTTMDHMAFGLSDRNTRFNISRQAAAAGKIAFPIPGETPFGGVIEIQLIGDDLPQWIEAATWHSGRQYVPRGIGDEFAMRKDGEVRHWHANDR